MLRRKRNAPTSRTSALKSEDALGSRAGDGHLGGGSGRHPLTSRASTELPTLPSIPADSHVGTCPEAMSPQWAKVPAE